MLYLKRLRDANQASFVKRMSIVLSFFFLWLDPPRAIEIDSAVNEHLLLPIFHEMHLP